MNPGVSAQVTPIFPIRSTNARAPSSASGDVCSASTISTSFIADGGLKKCNPSTRCGLVHTCARLLMESDEVLLASSATGSSAASSAAKTERLRSRRSGTASIAISASLRSGMRSPRATRAATLSSPARAASLRIRAIARSRDAPSVSINSTEYPARAATKAIPAPIAPPPTTKMRSCTSGVLRGDMEKPLWRVRSSTYLIESEHLRIRSDEIELPNGVVLPNYYVRESLGFVMIFALTPAREVVLVRQYRYGIDEVIVELPAGSIDRGEDPLVCAKRELAEETGYTATRWQSFSVVPAEPVRSNSFLHAFLAFDATPTQAQQLDAT